MQVFIGLGSNMQSPLTQVTSACMQLQKHPNIDLKHRSHWYSSKAVGPPQPDYINGVAELETTLMPETLLNELQAIENQHGRTRTLRWGPRTLDLDILLYGNQIIDSERLHIPHPWMHKRNFVLRPLLDIAPNLILPNGDRVAELLDTLGTQNLTRLNG